MRIETYGKNKNLFEENYNRVKDKFLPLNIPIELCMEGIRGKNNFFLYFSYDAGVRGSNVTYAVNIYKVYKTWNGTSLSRINRDRERNMFKREGEFERFDQYVKSRKK